ncbi:Hydrogenase-4 component G, partial [hydrothermal vent metagenome]
GGVAVDIDAAQITQLQRQQVTLRAELDELMSIIDNSPSLEDRLVGAGVLLPETAALIGAVGYVGKASGVDYDLRRDHAYAPYHRLDVESPLYQTGDVASRVKVRAEEIGHSLQLLDQLLNELPDDGISARWVAPAANTEGLGLVEGWRGETLCFVRFGAAGRIARFFPRDPSWLSWPALEQLIHGNIVPDFPVCNKSVNASYSGHDL